MTAILANSENAIFAAHHVNAAFVELKELQPNLDIKHIIELTKAASVFALAKELTMLDIENSDISYELDKISNSLNNVATAVIEAADIIAGQEV